MNRAYNFLIRLQDMFSGPLARAQAAYQRFGSGWERLANRMPGMLRRTTQSVEELRAKLLTLERKRNISIDTREIQQANREIARTRRELERLQGMRSNQSGSGGSGWIGGLFRGALPAMGIAGLLAAGGSALSAGMDREQTNMAFEQFLKTPQATQAMMAQLNKFADKTPYSNKEVYGAGRGLLAAGYDPQEVLPRMKILGNVAAGAQTNFEELTGLYGKVKQKGFADTSDIWQFTDRKIPILDALSKVTGKDNATLLKMAEQRKLDMKTLDRAMIELGGEGGRYGGMLDKLSNTAGGKLSTFMGTMGNKIAEWAATQNSTLGKIFDFGTSILEKMGPIEEVFGRFFGVIGDVFNALQPIWQALANVATSFGLAGDGVGMFTGAITILSYWLKGASVVINLVSSVLGYLIDSVFGKSVIVIAAVTYAVWGLNVAWAASPFGVVIAGITAIVGGFMWAYENVESFREVVIKMWTAVKSIFSNLSTVLKALVMPTPDNISAAIAVYKNAWDAGGKAYELDKKAREKAKNNPPKLSSGLTTGAAGGTGTAGSGSGSGGLGKSAGLESAVSGAKSTNVTINLKSLVEGGLHIHSMNLSEGADEIERIMVDRLLRVVNSANAVAL